MMINKKIISVLTVVLCLLFVMSVKADVWVDSYYRDDGTYVEGHWRSDPDGNPYNNWSFPNNINPYTGEVADGNPSTYLDNYYENNNNFNLNTVNDGYNFDTNFSSDYGLDW